MPQLKIADSTIVITGAARGLGASMACRMAAKGAKLALIDIDQQSLEDTRSLCASAGASKVETYGVNVTSEPDVEQLFDNIANDFGSVHGLVRRRTRFKNVFATMAKCH